MADTFKTLYQGQLGNSVATVATVGAAKMWIVKNITAVNTDSVTRTFGLYLNGTTAAHAITATAISLAAAASWTWDGMSLSMNAADTLAGGASAATVVTVTVTGDEVS